MADLINDFTWSFSRDRTFKSCKRKYYLSYYHSWGGWDASAPADVRQAYILKKITTIPMLVGDIIHNAAEGVLEKLRRKQEPSREATEKAVIREFRRRWKEASNKFWENNPSRATNLFELYYDERPEDVKLIEYRDIMMDCVQGFFDSESYQFIKTLAPVEWLTVEELDSFIYADTKVWIKLDFAARRDEKIYIYDWKTGKEAKEDENQLAVYALYAMEKWQIPLDDLRLFDIYLRKQLPVKMKVTKKIIANAEKEIESSIAAMKKLLTDKNNNVAEQEQFPMTENQRECKRCQFKGACHPDWKNL